MSFSCTHFSQQRLAAKKSSEPIDFTRLLTRRIDQRQDALGPDLRLIAPVIPLQASGMHRMIESRFSSISEGQWFRGR